MSNRTSAASSPRPWWTDAVIYQIYVRSFADSDGDGIGDLPGITSRLDYLAELGVDAIWITPFYTSPQHDHGYDVADYCDVDKLFGSLEDADALLARARELNIKVIVDIVPNHSSNEHDWFLAALAAEPGSPERDRYLFRPGKGPDASEPPNNWMSVFGGPAWTRVGDTDQWYLHLFDTTQPDFNWRNPEIPAMFEDVLRFWLDRGVDGFRVDVAHGLFKEESLRDQVVEQTTSVIGTSAVNAEGGMVAPHVGDEPMWDQPEVHDVYRSWRKVLDSYDGDRMAVSEAWLSTEEKMAAFVRPDELDQTFNFGWLTAAWSAEAYRDVIEDTLRALEPVGAVPSWVLSNHDVVRYPTRYGGGQTGLLRARAAMLTMLALPGSCYLYQGEELGLPECEVEPEFRQDPSWFRTGEAGRDGCRVPIPWSGDSSPYGFGPGDGQPWLPQPAEWAELSVAAQEGDPESTLETYRRALHARREHFTDVAEEIADLTAEGDVLSFTRAGVRVLLNTGTKPVELPDGEVLIASSPLNDGTLAPNQAVWLVA